MMRRKGAACSRIAGYLSSNGEKHGQTGFFATARQPLSKAGPERSGRGSFDRVVQLVDGLFLGQNFVRACLEHGLDLVALADNR